jgi:hypothetical protein
MTPHGTVSRYRYGCRCDECKAANAAQARRLRAASRERGFAGLTHGRRSTYDAGCRCVACRRIRKTVPVGYRKRPAAHLPTGTCPECGRTLSLVAFGRLRVHGPQAKRCPGSSTKPDAVREAA